MLHCSTYRYKTFVFCLYINTSYNRTMNPIYFRILKVFLSFVTAEFCNPQHHIMIDRAKENIDQMPLMRQSSQIWCSNSSKHVITKFSSKIIMWEQRKVRGEFSKNKEIPRCHWKREEDEGGDCMRIAFPDTETWHRTPEHVATDLSCLFNCES